MSTPKKKQRWSESLGPYGSTVRVAEREPGGILYVLWVDARGKQQKRSLGHRDKKLGKRQALELSHRLAMHEGGASAERLTLGRLINLYLQEGLHGRSEKHRGEAKRKLQLVGEFFGLEREVESLSRSDVDRFIEARRTGAIRPAKSQRNGGVGMTAIRHDLVALKTALNWAVGYRDARGRQLLAANPLVGLKLPREVSPRRPVAGEDRYVVLRAIADRLNPRFELALDLAYATGHRITAILSLKWEDVSLAALPHAPFGIIRWKAEHDKVENEHVAPLNQVAHDALLKAQRERPGIGGAWVFATEKNPAVPTSYRTAKRWLRTAEELAELDHLKGDGWHAFRRGWATARKEYPLKDVAQAGGWKSTSSLLQCYQHADAETVFRVVTEPAGKRSAG